MNFENKITSILIALMVVGSIILLTLHFSSTRQDKTVVELDEPEYFLTLEYSWERAFRSNCRYTFALHGFQNLEGNAVPRPVTVIGDCDKFQIGDTLIIR